ncbi:unnamed protein product [Parnassius mnemosyne]|uniref:Uncharacterized protein n=1 Tax=Parnassius mnemosyne TaxID=213953 RepID=A0AAV1LBG1_9NEOP
MVHYANLLAGFDYNIKLRKTTEHANADYFSRLNKSTETENDNLTDDDAFYLNQISEMPVTLQEIREATRKDPDLQKLYMDIQSGNSTISPVKMKAAPLSQSPGKEQLPVKKQPEQEPAQPTLPGEVTTSNNTPEIGHRRSQRIRRKPDRLNL